MRMWSFNVAWEAPAFPPPSSGVSLTKSTDDPSCVPVQRARKTGKAPPCTKVVVDVREFRSSLPNLLDLVTTSHHPLS